VAFSGSLKNSLGCLLSVFHERERKRERERERERRREGEEGRERWWRLPFCGASLLFYLL
jgi:DNA invertase Pin-like site-specific DNA recombinase